MNSAIGYVRLSQRSDASIERQRENIDTYAEENGFTLERVYSDGQESSGFDGERSEYIDLVESVRSGEIDAVIANDKRRLSRDVDEVMRLVADFRENDVEWHTFKSGAMNLSDPMRAAIEVVRAAAAHEEKMREIEKSQEATAERVDDPDVDHGRPRFGMTYSEDGRRQVPGDRFGDVQEILHLRNDGMSYADISDRVGVATSTVYRVVGAAGWYRERANGALDGGLNE